MILYHLLAFDMYNLANGKPPDVLNEIFKLREINHNVRYSSQFIVAPVHNVYYEAKSVAYLGPAIPGVTKRLVLLQVYTKK